LDTIKKRMRLLLAVTLVTHALLVHALLVVAGAAQTQVSTPFVIHPELQLYSGVEIRFADTLDYLSTAKAQAEGGQRVSAGVAVQSRDRNEWER
jgi:hypothetical protein